MDMWTLRLWAFSKRFPHWSQANSSSVSALCLVMWYLSDARCLHWKPQISHLQSKAGAEQGARGRSHGSLLFVIENKRGRRQSQPHSIFYNHPAPATPFSSGLQLLAGSCALTC